MIKLKKLDKACLVSGLMSLGLRSSDTVSINAMASFENMVSKGAKPKYAWNEILRIASKGNHNGYILAKQAALQTQKSRNEKIPSDW